VEEVHTVTEAICTSTVIHTVGFAPRSWSSKFAFSITVVRMTFPLGTPVADTSKQDIDTNRCRPREDKLLTIAVIVRFRK
jgi:hypothetical protein